MNQATRLSLFPAMIVLCAQMAFATEPETTFTAGFGGENSTCGTMLPSAFGNYDHDSDDVAGHAYVRLSPGGACGGSVTVDTEVSKRVGFAHEGDHGNAFVSAIVGFDQYTQTYEVEPNAHGTPAFHGQGEEGITAAFGLGWDFGKWRWELGANAWAQYDDRIEPLFVQMAGTFGKANEWELDATLGLPVSSATLSWRDETTLRLSYNANELGNYDGTGGELVEGPPTLQIAVDVTVF